MIKSRTAQLIFQTIYCVLGFIGILSSVGYFNASFNSQFHVYYTNLSNYICIGVMLVSLIRTAKKKEDGYCDTAPTFNFACVIMIMVTFLVYNILLAGDQTPITYLTSLSNMLLHLILPLMFIANFALFYKRETVKWYFPLLCMIMPLIYVGYILIRAAFVGEAADKVIYPYFFLDVAELGWGGFFTWVIVLMAVFIAIGYLIFAIDNFKVITEKLKKKN